ncbi:unnamed protein product [Moneuplotes crassus]|uniref:Uncharacterized protein n=1 Tax=Euplotes crassus TaxID=5936 RepID=A0AAD1XI94_EUPCR|nr:unnamed protein product [Moneuplotes crassus]
MRKIYKEDKKWKKYGILSCFGIPKPQEKIKSIFDREFSITDMIEKEKKKEHKKSPLESRDRLRPQAVKRKVNTNRGNARSSNPKKKSEELTTTNVSEMKFSTHINKHLRVSSQPNIKTRYVVKYLDRFEMLRKKLNLKIPKKDNNESPSINFHRRSLFAQYEENDDLIPSEHGNNCIDSQDKPCSRELPRNIGETTPKVKPEASKKMSASLYNKKYLKSQRASGNHQGSLKYTFYEIPKLDLRLDNLKQVRTSKNRGSVDTANCSMSYFDRKSGRIEGRIINSKLKTKELAQKYLQINQNKDIALEQWNNEVIKQNLWKVNRPREFTNLGNIER